MSSKKTPIPKTITETIANSSSTYIHPVYKKATPCLRLNMSFNYNCSTKLVDIIKELQSILDGIPEEYKNIACLNEEFSYENSGEFEVVVDRPPNKEEIAFIKEQTKSNAEKQKARDIEKAKELLSKYNLDITEVS